MSGFLSGWLREEPLEECLRLGNACGAIVVSRHGCSPAMPTREELEYFLNMPERPRSLRDDEWLSHLHRATTRNDPEELRVLARPPLATRRGSRRARGGPRKFA
jgi:5-dehydro-2-deoxygluconokinase